MCLHNKTVSSVSLPISQQLAMKVLLTTGNTLMKHFKHLKWKNIIQKLSAQILTMPF